MRKYKMFVDESGREFESHYSKYYILLGCIIEESLQNELEILAGQIKYRYFKDINIVFHSRDIAENKKTYSIFGPNKKLKQEFLNELINFVYKSHIKITCAIVDKERAFKIGWKPEVIVEKTTDSILRDFLNFIYSYKKSNNSGVIIYEASGFNKDSGYLKAFNKVLTPGFEGKNPEFWDIRNHLTSVSFATKLNKDIETELSDLLTYAAYKKYLLDNELIEIPRTSYEFKIIRALESKLLTPQPTLRLPKGGYDYMSKVVGYNILPTISKKRRVTSQKSTRTKRTA